MKKLTDPQKIAELNTSIREFWKNIQAEIASGRRASIAASNFWKEYCGIDFTIDFDTLNPACRYRECGNWAKLETIYFMVGNNGFRFNRYGLSMVRKRNPYVFLGCRNADMKLALRCFYTDMTRAAREVEIISAMNKHIIP